MPEPKQVFTIVRRLYSPAALPWTELVLSSNLNRLGGMYKFKEIGQPNPEAPPPLNSIVANAGEFTIAKNNIVSVLQLSIQPNLIELQIAAETKIADAYLLDLESFLRALDPKKSALDQYTTTHQTIVIAKLDVPFEALISDQLRSFIAQNVQPALKLKDAAPHIQLAHLSWQVTYRPESTDYNYIPKALTFEPRIGGKQSENLYFTQSPTDFETHMRLLQEFEAAFRQKRQPRRAASK